MAAKRGKSQARRNSGNGLPGWAWMILGIVIALVAVMVLPRYLKPGENEGFFRPQPNAAAQPAVSAIDEEDVPPAERPAPRPQRAATPAPAATADEPPEYDFYTVLPEQEVAMTDAELAASAREEAERQRRTLAAQRQREQEAARAAAAAGTTAPAAPVASAPAAPSPAASAPAPAAARATAPADNARYILQAGSFSASGDAEALKARIALLGLSARVESGSADGKTVYRVRMGPYGSATELAEAKQKLGNGGLPALAIKAN